MDAMLALRQFRQEVQKKAEIVLSRNLGELGQALGISLEFASQSAFVNPANPSRFEGTWSCIATNLIMPNIEPIFSTVLFGLSWEEQDGEIVLVVFGGFYFIKAKDRNRASQVFGQNSGLKVDADGFYLKEGLTPEEAGSFETKLNNIIKNWIGLWRRVGGLNAVVSEPNYQPPQ
jgi:hypothetical protein